MVGILSDRELLDKFSEIVGGEVDLVFVREFKRQMRECGGGISTKSFKELMTDYFEKNL